MRDSDLIEISHGAGGKLADELLTIIKESFTKRQYGSGIGIDSFDDGGTFVPPAGSQLVMSADSHSIHPLFFPGGNIGVLATTGTFNDVAVMGAEPMVLTSCLVIEEGFRLGDLKAILKSMDDECIKADVSLIAGDTKVMPKRTLDGMIIATTAIGYCNDGELVQDCGVKDGDLIIASNSIGSHGIALMSHREGIEFSTKLESDVRCVLPLIRDMKKHVKSSSGEAFNSVVHAMKDPTRGGLASAINEFTSKSRTVDITLFEDRIPVEPAVEAASEMLGLDVLSITSEGCFIAAISPDHTDEIVKLLKKSQAGKNAAIIGEASAKKSKKGKVFIETVIGGKRILHKPLGELIPRVC